MRSLGLDIGDRRVGVAISDIEGILASPLETIANVDDDKTIVAILKLVTKYEVQHIVIGLPYSLDGSIGQQANKVMTFIDKLSKYTEIDISTQDERLSTVEAKHLLMQAGTKGDKIKLKRDAAAATLILQRYLDNLEICDQ